jgi:hypothetical protein
MELDFVEYQDKMLKCLQLQDEINKRINKKWTKERTEEDFFRAIWLETAELMEELPWKWWKRVETDYDNLQIEVVDIFHFLLSLILLKHYKVDKKDLYRDYVDIAISLFFYGLENSKKLSINELIVKTETLVKQALSGNDMGLILTFAEIVNTVFEDRSLKTHFEAKEQATALQSPENDARHPFNQMYMLYIGKNILNRIRQEKGYKTGVYKKVINGLEDNKYLTQVIKQVKNEEILEDVIRRAFEELQT